MSTVMTWCGQDGRIWSRDSDGTWYVTHRLGPARPGRQTGDGDMSARSGYQPTDNRPEPTHPPDTSIYIPPQPNAALVVGPDDHLVISLPANTTREVLDRFLDELLTRLPREQVTVVCGAEQLAVIRNVLVESPFDSEDRQPSTQPPDG